LAAGHGAIVEKTDPRLSQQMACPHTTSLTLFSFPEELIHWQA